MSDVLYTFEHDGERMDLECASKVAVTNWADDWYAARCQSKHSPMKNGEEFEDEGFIIKYLHNDDGEFAELSREKYRLSYEHYHGDYKEHCTHY